MKAVRGWLFLCLLSASCSIAAQDVDSLFLKPDSLYTADDSLSIFTLIDSLLSLDAQTGSQLGVRVGYNSNVLSAGRTLGIDNFGLSPGLSYYHKSGLYADVSGFWSKDFDPTYYLTIMSVGYMYDFSRAFTVIAGYDRYFYHTKSADTYIPYRNTISVTPSFEKKNIALSGNYSFYFGDKYAHRVMPGLGYRLEKRKLFKKIDRVSITPSLYVLWGNEVITELEFIPPQTIREAIDNYITYGTRYKILQRDRDVFGIMNYSLSLPLMVTEGNFSFSFNYSYSIPKALPGEPETLSESSFLSASVSWFIDLKRNKKPL